MPAYDFRSPRLYVEPALAGGEMVALGSAQAHYLGTVLRIKAGDHVLVFNGRDGEWDATMAVQKRAAALVIGAKMRAQTAPGDLHYIFAPLKTARLDYMVQKAVEMGASRLQPVLTRHGQVARINTERMRANAIEAAEQSGRLSVPAIHPATTLDKLLANWPSDRKLIFCDEAGEAPTIADVLKNASGVRWAVLTGPEGGFDPAERKKIRAQPFVTPVSLGARILRADTAALTALAVWQALAGDWQSVFSGTDSKDTVD